MTQTPFPKRRGKLWKQEARDAASVYEKESEGLHVLNSTALAIWELCDGETSPNEIAHAVSELTSLDEATAEIEVATTLEALRSIGLLEPASD